MPRQYHKFDIKVGNVVALTVGGYNRKAAVNEAVRYATEYAGAGFPDVSIAGIDKADFDAIEDVDGWPKTVVQ
jgi:hypothetical protein